MAKIKNLYPETLKLPGATRDIHIPAISAIIETDDGEHQRVIMGLANIFPKDEQSAIKSAEKFLVSLKKSTHLEIEYEY